MLTEPSTCLGLATVTDQQGFSYTYSFCQESVWDTVCLPCSGSFCGCARRAPSLHIPGTCNRSARILLHVLFLSGKCLWNGVFTLERLFWRLCSHSPESPHSCDVWQMSKDSLARTLFVRKMFVKQCFYLAAVMLTDPRVSTFLGLATDQQRFSYT